MRKWFIRLFVLILVVIIAGVAGLFYIRPTETLDLNYRKVPIRDRAIDMVKRTSLEMIVTEADVNNLLKAKLAEDPIVREDVEVTGVKFTLLSDLLIADLNVLWKELVPSSLRIVYRLKWDSAASEIVATVEEAHIKAIPLPKSSIAGFVIPLGDELPKPLKVEKVGWGVGELKVKLKKPSLMDLKELL